MFHVIELIIFSVGTVAITIAAMQLAITGIEKLIAARKRKRDHDQRVISLLEAINNKLPHKP